MPWGGIRNIPCRLRFRAASQAVCASPPALRVVHRWCMALGWPGPSSEPARCQRRALVAPIRPVRGPPTVNAQETGGRSQGSSAGRPSVPGGTTAGGLPGPGPSSVGPRPSRPASPNRSHSTSRRPQHPAHGSGGVRLRYYRGVTEVSTRYGLCTDQCLRACKPLLLSARAGAATIQDSSGSSSSESLRYRVAMLTPTKRATLSLSPPNCSSNRWR